MHGVWSIDISLERFILQEHIRIAINYGLFVGTKGCGTRRNTLGNLTSVGVPSVLIVPSTAIRATL